MLGGTGDLWRPSGLRRPGSQPLLASCPFTVSVLGERAPAARGDGLLDRPLGDEESSVMSGFGDGERLCAEATFPGSGLRV